MRLPKKTGVDPIKKTEANVPEDQDNCKTTWFKIYLQSTRLHTLKPGALGAYLNSSVVYDYGWDWLVE